MGSRILVRLVIYSKPCCKNAAEHSSNAHGGAALQPHSKGGYKPRRCFQCQNRIPESSAKQLCKVCLCSFRRCIPSFMLKADAKVCVDGRCGQRTIQGSL